MKKRKRRASANRRPPTPPARPVAPSKGSVRQWVAVAIGAAVVGLIAWFALRDQPTQSIPAATFQRSITFIDRGADIDFVLNNGTTEDKLIPDSVLGGVAVLDCDNDGLLDIFFTNGARFPDLVKADETFHNRLYRNRGSRTFEDITRPAGLEGAGYSMGAATADYDNDGLTDLFVASVNRNILYRNQGECRFADVTKSAGLEIPEDQPWSVAAAWLDYDNDGWLDLFVVNYLDWSVDTNRVCGDPGRRLSCSPAGYEGLPNLFYRNRGDGTFADASEESGISGHVGKGMSAGIADYDSDGFPDILVTNDTTRNFLFRNSQGRGFEEFGVQAGIAFTADGIPVSSMGLDFRDLTGDGLPDAVITALYTETYPLFVNNGNGVFADSTYATRIGLASFNMAGWSIGAADFDNDGTLELFSANSHVSENIDFYKQQAYRLPNAIFRKSPDGMYENVASEAGAALERSEAHRGAAFGDLDNDGRIDVVVSAIGVRAAILFNESEAGHWLSLDLEGTTSNRSGIGARVKLTDENGRSHYNHVTTAVGYASASDSRVHFGLGPSERASEIEIRWPSGKVQTLTNVSADQILAVQEPR